MFRLLLVWMFGAVLSSCVSKGDTKVTADDEGRGSLCAQQCEREEEQCGNIANCEADCADRSETCPDENQLFLECALSQPVGCDATNGAYTSGCSDETEELEACLGVADTVVVETFGDCRADNAVCEEGSSCVETSDPNYDALCFPECESDEGCIFGCCLGTIDGVKACALPADCSPVPIGNPCLNNGDCESGQCLFGGCIAECETDADCGTNFLGHDNGCWLEGEPPVCLPGCETNQECQNYFGAELVCKEHEGGRYCF